MQQVAKISVYKNKYTRRKKQSDALTVYVSYRKLYFYKWVKDGTNLNIINNFWLKNWVYALLPVAWFLNTPKVLLHQSYRQISWIKGVSFLRSCGVAPRRGGGGKEGERGREDYNKIVSGVSRLDVPGADLRWCEVVWPTELLLASTMIQPNHRTQHLWELHQVEIFHSPWQVLFISIKMA